MKTKPQSFLFSCLLWLLPALALAGTATLSWTPPTQNVDGSPLTDLAGYNVYWGCAQSGQYPNVVNLTNPGLTTYVLSGLPDGVTCYFVMTAVNSSGVESVMTGEVSKAMPIAAPVAPNPPTNLTAK